MKNNENLMQANVNNLTSLWQEASLFERSFIETPLFNYVATENSSWPNRLWFTDYLKPASICAAQETAFTKFPDLIIPHWDSAENDSTRLLEQNGFSLLFEQLGMLLKTSSLFEEKKELTITRVVTKNDSIRWSKLFKLSFGYEIRPDILINTNKKITYYLVHHHEKPVGTALCYRTNNVTGIHAVGIVPEARRKGFAEELMKVLINLCTRENSEYISLQASAMGKGLYLKLGFEKQFVLKNYALQSHSWFSQL